MPDERKSLAVGIVDAAPDLDPLLEHDPKRALGEFGVSRISKSTVPISTFLALPPDEVAAEDLRMQRADEDAEPPQRQAGFDRRIADVCDHLRRGP